MKLLFILLLSGWLFIPVSAQTSHDMYTYKQIGNKYVVSIQNREEIVEALNAFCEERGIKSGTIYGIGAIDELILRFFNPQTKQYVDKTYQEQMEIANLTGNISQMEGKAYLHLHVTVGRSDYSALAGHLLSATLNGAGEFVVEDLGTTVTRVYVPEIGLNCYKLDE
ncbi:DNA-binding protein [Bacteroides caecigallinarum]|uniref:PPC domain-containing DNA-binding protein n=1 Tax=Bacteroides caecigallinarum TaxID=1411144 RepID=UPI0019589286|nr:PPC domain-containing DNA-binding protein [Bacteroides caecigallinarum]MBM6865490.1 DNA-binding protein [Bacteroides caecigallinarum]